MEAAAPAEQSTLDLPNAEFKDLGAEPPWADLVPEVRAAARITGHCATLLDVRLGVSEALALAVAARLNKLFRSEDFSVARLLVTGRDA